MEPTPARPARLSASKLKEWREATWLAQGKRCAITGYSISLSEAVADHDHATGHVRGVLHRGVNSLLGKIENNHKRYGVSLPMLRAMAPAVAAYIEKDYSANVFYPTHRTEDEKRELRNKRARDARAKKKGTECK